MGSMEKTIASTKRADRMRFLMKIHQLFLEMV